MNISARRLRRKERLLQIFTIPSSSQFYFTMLNFFQTFLRNAHIWCENALLAYPAAESFRIVGWSLGITGKDDDWSEEERNRCKFETTYTLYTPNFKKITKA